MLSFFAYIPTIAYVPHYAFGIIFFIWIYRKLIKTNFHINVKFTSKQLTSIIIIFSIILLSFINKALVSDNLFDAIPYNAAMILTLMAASIVTKKDAKILVYLICFEAIVVIFEFILGVHSLIPSLNSTLVEGQNLLYFNRPYGLGVNSSGIAYKLLLAILLIDFYKLNFKFKTTILVILLTAIIFNFSRTIIIVMLIYGIIKFFKTWLENQKKSLSGTLNQKEIIALIGIPLIALIIVGFTIINNEKITYQFNKGTETTELSGREIIWPEFIEMIKTKPLLGNHSNKTLIDYHDEKQVAHAHNSFLQILTDHGIIIALLYIILLLMNIRKNNRLVIFILILYSLTQYGFFWGISLFDIVLFSILIFDKSTKNNEDTYNYRNTTAIQ